MIYLEKDVYLLDVHGSYVGEQVVYADDGVYAYLIPPVVSP